MRTIGRRILNIPDQNKCADLLSGQVVSVFTHSVIEQTGYSPIRVQDGPSGPDKESLVLGARTMFVLIPTSPRVNESSPLGPEQLYHCLGSHEFAWPTGLAAI